MSADNKICAYINTRGHYVGQRCTNPAVKDGYCEVCVEKEDVAKTLKPETCAYVYNRGHYAGKRCPSPAVKQGYCEICVEKDVVRKTLKPDICGKTYSRGHYHPNLTCKKIMPAGKDVCLDCKARSMPRKSSPYPSWEAGIEGRYRKSEEIIDLINLVSYTAPMGPLEMWTWNPDAGIRLLGKRDLADLYDLDLDSLTIRVFQGNMLYQPEVYYEFRGKGGKPHIFVYYPELGKVTNVDYIEDDNYLEVAGRSWVKVFGCPKYD